MREPCGQSVFAPCPTDCTRNCSARSFALTDAIMAERRRISLLTLSLCWAAVFITLAAAGAYGLSHEERAYQNERV